MDKNIEKALMEFLTKNHERIMNGDPKMSPTLGDDKQGLQMLANKAGGMPGTPALPGVPMTPPPANEPPIQAYSDGGIVDSLRHLLSSDKTEAMTADSIDPIIETSSDTPKGYAHGGEVECVDPSEREFENPVPGPSQYPSMYSGKDGRKHVSEAWTAAEGGIAPGPAFDPSAGMPPVAAPPPQMPMNDMPQPNSSIQDYIASQKAQIGKYGPEEQMAVSKNLLGAQNGLSGRVANGAATFADALMQGVARAGNPGFAAQLQQRQQNQANTQLEALKSAHGANIENAGANQRLDAQDPMSALSESKRAQNGPILQAMGFDPKTIGKMSAAEMDTTLQILKDFRGKDMEVAVAKMKAAIEARRDAESARHNVQTEGLEGKKAGEATRHNLADEANKGEEMQTGALEKAAAIPLTSRIANMFGVNPAQEALEEKAGLHNSGHGIPDLGDTFNGHKVTKVTKVK